jgi:MFS family permease
MNYTASVSDFFKSPKWMMNLLLGGVCVLIPVIGPLVIKGWLVGGFWAGEEKRPESFPDFDFNHFTKYLERGLWPFLVTMVVSIPFSVIIGVIMFATMLLSSLLLPNSHGSEAGVLAVLIFLFAAVIYIVLTIGMMLLLTPLTIRAALTQDFGSSFNFTFIKRFIALTWKDSVLASLFLIVASIVLIFGGALVLCVGMYFAIVIVSFCGEHLHKQLYRLYLSRGGEPVPVSPKLLEPALPPPL